MGPETPPAVCTARPIVLHRIARQEGFYVAGSLPQRLHNPGSLVFAHQAGALRGPGRYAAFADDRAGWEALERDVAAKRRDGMPLSIGWAYLPY